MSSQLIQMWHQQQNREESSISLINLQLAVYIYIYIKCYMHYCLQRSVFCVFYVHRKEENKNKITTMRQSYLSGLNPVIIEFESSLIMFFSFKHFFVKLPSLFKQQRVSWFLNFCSVSKIRKHVYCHYFWIASLFFILSQFPILSQIIYVTMLHLQRLENCFHTNLF